MSNLLYHLTIENLIHNIDKELSSLFMTHRINVMHALVMFHEYIPYSLGVMALTRLTIWN